MNAPRPSIDESYWMATTPTTHYPAPESDLTADVAVVGGGIAGLCTAWDLVRAGLDVIVLEADRIAAGVSGYTTAKMTAAHGLMYARLEAEHGADDAGLYALSQQEAVERTAALCAELDIDADLERAPALTYVQDPERVDELRREAAAARRAGLDASFVTDTDLPFAVAGAVRVEGQLQFHPRKFLLALAEHITAAGGRIFERARVTGLHDGHRCRLTTEGGATVEARDAVIATHYPVFDRTLLFTLLKPRRELVIAAPVPSAAAPAGMYITPEGGTRSLRSAPYDDGRRLLVVTGESFTPGEGDVRARSERLADWARANLPHFAEADTCYRWAAQDNDSVDHLPYVGHAHPGTQHVYVATGFGGWGMSNGVMAGRLLTAHIVGGPRPAWTELYDPRRLPPVRDAGRLAAHQAAVAKHFVGDRLHTGHVDSVADIPPGSGAVVRLDGRRCAVHRDEAGHVSAVSARCTHLGCLVHFNNAEQAWECPCHGSRFATDGSVLHGPATRPLEPREIPEPPA
ncbi:FAD-dependent oxidoreductase [Streptomyces aurantiacus]|uniref:Putative Rieske 2Fe-2S iron-sulfur protein YhfW n=1 Tax=Streptomyces aurantiacus JA 4570 TaxID=1286094 RepID=S3ZGL9_9ACTN|nr:FAD-dependent oxidoreductase [Streptomyces aurantiacus]EPH42796.1 putative Rieske 2Fe-2S iron-sulfur protein YhfW [Streptomyces aurantiacus JA 4570]